MSLRAVKQIIEPSKPRASSCSAPFARQDQGSPGDKEVSQATKGDDSVTWIGRVK
jgi:hypothetical protein